MTDAILLVEDDENDVFLMRRAIKVAGILNPIRVATDGQQAIDYFKNSIKPGSNGDFPLPGLVLLDLKLPYVMGLDVLKWIRQHPELAPIVLIVSASSEAEDIATAYQRGANAYLVKPSETRELEAMVRAIKDFWLIVNTPSSQPNLANVVAGLAQKCRRQQAPAASNEVNHEDLELYLTGYRRAEGMQPSLRGSTSDTVQQRIIHTLKTSPSSRFCHLSPRQVP